MRQSNLQPAWFTASNWGNASYDPWTDYLTGRLSDERFQQLCPRPTDYCLRDVWDIRRGTLPRDIHRTTEPDFNWNGIHALALRYFRTGEVAYARKWLTVVQYYADWSEAVAKRGSSEATRGTPAPLLEWGMVWGGIFTAMAIIAKGMPAASGERASNAASAFAPVPGPAFAAASEILPPEALISIAQAFINGAAPVLVRFYSQPRYVPNQRMFGLEAVAAACAFFPGLPSVASLRRSLDPAMLDVMIRYRHRDGGQVEQSFNYVQSIINAAERIAKLPMSPDPVWKVEARQTAEGWFLLARALEVPGGGLPQVGNSIWGHIDPIVPRIQMAGTSVAFPYSGYYAMRSDWSPQAAYLFFFVRRAARGHTMAGGNSVQVAAYGRQLIIAGGSASYNAAKGNASVDAYLSEHSSFKTSTVVVDGKSQRGGITQGLELDAHGKPDITIAPRQPLNMRWHTSANFDYAEGVHDQGYERTVAGATGAPVLDVIHWRRVVFVRQFMAWVVVDVLRSDARHRYTQIWKFSAPKNGLKIPGFTHGQVSLAENRRTFRTSDDAPGAVNVTLQQFCDSRLSYRSYFGSDSFGYYNPRPLTDAVPAVDVHASWEGSGPQVVVTLITPHRGLQPDYESVQDRTDEAVSGFALGTGGSRLSVVAAATPRRLDLIGFRADHADLLVALETPGKPPAILSIGTGGSREVYGREQTPIAAPRGFRWVTDSSGALRPTY